MIPNKHFLPFFICFLPYFFFLSQQQENLTNVLGFQTQLQYLLLIHPSHLHQLSFPHRVPFHFSFFLHSECCVQLQIQPEKYPNSATWLGKSMYIFFLSLIFLCCSGSPPPSGDRQFSHPKQTMYFSKCPRLALLNLACLVAFYGEVRMSLSYTARIPLAVCQPYNKA